MKKELAQDLIQTQEQMSQRVKRIDREHEKIQHGITEELKAKRPDDMGGFMNSIKATAEEMAAERADLHLEEKSSQRRILTKRRTRNRQRIFTRQICKYIIE